jgi:Uncharacterized protein conserved in bacteria
VQETGDFELDGVTFPAAEIQLEFMDPAAEEEGAGGAMFPTGNLVDDLDVPGVGTLKATMINAGIPTFSWTRKRSVIRVPNYRTLSTATIRRWRCSKPFVRMALCVWA